MADERTARRAEVDRELQLAGAHVCALIQLGVLPDNVWAFVRTIDVAGHPDKVLIWTVLESPN